MAFTLEKYKREWALFSEAWRDAPPATHKGGNLANKFVEACKASGYIAGHLLMVVILVALVAILV